MHPTSILTALLASFATLGMVTAIPVAAPGDVGAVGEPIKVLRVEARHDDAPPTPASPISTLLTEVENAVNGAPKAVGGLVGGLVGDLLNTTLSAVKALSNGA